MAGVKGRSGRNPDKAFADMVRVVCAEIYGDPVAGKRKLRVIAEKLVAQAIEGEGWAIQQVADRLDGKPAQDGTLHISHSVTEMTDEEILARIADIRRIGAVNGSGETPLDPSQLN